MYFARLQIFPSFIGLTFYDSCFEGQRPHLLLSCSRRLEKLMKPECGGFKRMVLVEAYWSLVTNLKKICVFARQEKNHIFLAKPHLKSLPKLSAEDHSFALSSVKSCQENLNCIACHIHIVATNNMHNVSISFFYEKTFLTSNNNFYVISTTFLWRGVWNLIFIGSSCSPLPAVFTVVPIRGRDRITGKCINIQYLDFLQLENHLIGF